MKKKYLADAYCFKGFIPQKTITGIFGDPYARVIVLKRYQKKRSVPSADMLIGPFTIIPCDAYVTYPVAPIESTSSWRYAGSTAESVAP